MVAQNFFIFLFYSSELLFRSDNFGFQKPSSWWVIEPHTRPCVYIYFSQKERRQSLDDVSLHHHPSSRRRRMSSNKIHSLKRPQNPSESVRLLIIKPYSLYDIDNTFIIRWWYPTKAWLDPLRQMAKIHPYPTPKGRSPKEIEGPTNDQPILTGNIAEWLTWTYSQQYHLDFGQANCCQFLQVGWKIQTRNSCRQES